MPPKSRSRKSCSKAVAAVVHQDELDLKLSVKKATPGSDQFTTTPSATPTLLEPQSSASSNGRVNVVTEEAHQDQEGLAPGLVLTANSNSDEMLEATPSSLPFTQ